MAIAFIIGMVPAYAFPQEVKGRQPVQRATAQARAAFHLPPGEAEKHLAGNAQALASIKHAKAVAMKREYMKSGDIGKLYTALNTAGEAIGLDPNVSRYWVTLGILHSEVARFNIFRSHEYAQESFRQALDLAPGDAAVRVLLAVNLAKTGEYEEALDHFENAVKKDILMLSGDIARWMNVCYLVDAHTKRGTIFYDNIQKIHPQYYFLNLFKAILYKAHFDYKSARTELTDLLGRGGIDGKTKEAARKLLGEIEREEGGRS